MERIPADSWHIHKGHVARYEYAASKVYAGETVNDIACGVGYGSELFNGVWFVGYDKQGIPDSRFIGRFIEADIDDPLWRPFDADVTTCFETLEHVKNPNHLAKIIAETTHRAIFISVPTQPTKHMNPYHLHDFTVSDIPPMFEGFDVIECWPQPEELSHVWYLERRNNERSNYNKYLR